MHCDFKDYWCQGCTTDARTHHNTMHRLEARLHSQAATVGEAASKTRLSGRLPVANGCTQHCLHFYTYLWCPTGALVVCLPAVRALVLLIIARALMLHFLRSHCAINGADVSCFWYCYPNQSARASALRALSPPCFPSSLLRIFLAPRLASCCTRSCGASGAWQLGNSCKAQLWQPLSTTETTATSTQ